MVRCGVVVARPRTGATSSGPVPPRLPTACAAVRTPLRVASVVARSHTACSLCCAPFCRTTPRPPRLPAQAAAAPSASNADVEDTIKRISSHKGVEGIVIFNYEGIALKSTMSRELTVKYAGLFVQLIVKARSVVRTVDAENDLLFLRVRTKKHEVLVAPDRDYVLLVVQDV